MTNIRQLAMFIVVGILIFLALLLLATQLTTLRLVNSANQPLVIEINEWPTPVPPTVTPMPSPTPTPAPGQPVPELTTLARRIAAAPPQNGGAAPDPSAAIFAGQSGNAWALSGNTIHFPHCGGRATEPGERVYDYYFLAMPHPVLRLDYSGANIIHSFDRLMDGNSPLTLTIGGNDYPAVYQSHYAFDCAYFGGATMEVTP